MDKNCQSEGSVKSAIDETETIEATRGQCQEFKKGASLKRTETSTTSTEEDKTEITDFR